MSLLDIRSQRIEVRHFGDITVECIRTGPDVSRNSIKYRLVAPGDDDRRTFANEQLGRRQSRSRTAAGNDSTFPSNLPISYPLLESKPSAILRPAGEQQRVVYEA